MSSIKEPDPPLGAVRAFEAVARFGKISAAATELGVSPSAISHQLKSLEEFFHKQLYYRDGRSIVLTDYGREYFRAVRSAFSSLRGASENLRLGKPDDKVRLSVIPLFARTLLFPRVADFFRNNKDIRLHIAYANHQNYFSDSADISIRFGDGQWKRYKAQRIVSGACAAFCSPDFLARNSSCSESPTQVFSYPLIHDEDTSSWQQWFANHDISQNPNGGLVVEDGNLALLAALNGLGIALLRPFMVELYVERGALVRLFEHETYDGRDYYICHLSDQPLSNAEDKLTKWIVNNCADDSSSTRGPRKA